MKTDPVATSILLPIVMLATALGAAEPPGEVPQTRNAALEVQWLGSAARLPPFDKVLLAPIELQFRAVRPMTGPTGYSGSRTEFPVPETEQERIAGIFDRILREELAESTHYTLTDQPGPGVLIIRPALRDIVSRVPPEEPVGRSYVFVDVVGEATLMVEFADGESGTTLATAADRRKAEPAGSIGSFGAVRANKVGANQEVRRLARRWGMSLDRRVEQLYQESRGD